MRKVLSLFGLLFLSLNVLAQSAKSGYEIVEFADLYQQYGTIIGFSEPYAYFIKLDDGKNVMGGNETIFHVSEKRGITATYIHSFEVNTQYKLHLYKCELRHLKLEDLPKYFAEYPKENKILRLGIDLLQDEDELGIQPAYKDSLIVFEQMSGGDQAIYKCTARYGYPWSLGMPVISDGSESLIGIVANKFDIRYNQSIDVVSVLAIRDILYSYANSLFKNDEFIDCYYFNLIASNSKHETDCQIAKRKEQERIEKQRQDALAEKRRKEAEAKRKAEQEAYVKSLSKEKRKNLRLSKDQFYTQDLFAEYRFLFDSVAKKSSWSIGSRSILWADRRFSLFAGISFGGFSQYTDSSKFDLLISDRIAFKRYSSRNYEILGGFNFGNEFYGSASVGYLTTLRTKLYMEQFDKRTVQLIPNASWIKYQIMCGIKMKRTDIAIGLEYYANLPEPFKKFEDQYLSGLMLPDMQSKSGRISICLHYSYRIFGFYGKAYKREAADKFID